MPCNQTKVKMKKGIVFYIAFLAVNIHASAQELFEGFGGKKGFYNKIVAKSDKLVVPQLCISFNTYYETKETASKKVRNSGVSSTVSASGITTTVLNTDMKLEDFQQLADEFQLILEEELVKAGIPVLSLNDFTKTKSFEKLIDKYGNKTENKQDKNSDDRIGKGRIRVFPKNSVFIFDENSLMRGGVASITQNRKLIKETKAIPLLQNITINFATMKIEAKIDGVDFSSEATIIPRMSISKNTFDFFGNDGVNNVAASLLAPPYIANTSYNANIYQNASKGKGLLEALFTNMNNIEFDPFIVDMNKDMYMKYARDLFRQYSSDFAKTCAAVKKK